MLGLTPLIVLTIWFILDQIHSNHLMNKSQKKITRNHVEHYLPFLWKPKETAPYTASSKVDHPSTGASSNPGVFHLHVKRHCNSQGVYICALVKIVPMKCGCHFLKYIRYILKRCINGENRTRKIWTILARTRKLVLSILNFNQLSSISLVKYWCNTLKASTSSANKIL